MHIRMRIKEAFSCWAEFPEDKLLTSLDEAPLRYAKRFGVNISQAAEAGLREILSEEKMATGGESPDPRCHQP